MARSFIGRCLGLSMDAHTWPLVTWQRGLRTGQLSAFISGSEGLGVLAGTLIAEPFEGVRQVALGLGTGRDSMRALFQSSGQDTQSIGVHAAADEDFTGHLSARRGDRPPRASVPLLPLPPGLRVGRGEVEGCMVRRAGWGQRLNAWPVTTERHRR